MSKLLPDPQIQSLRAMRAGDIAFANGGTISIGKQSAAELSPEGIVSVAPAAVLTLEAVSGPFNENPVVGVVDATTVSEDATESLSLAAVDALEAISGPFNESPVVGVGFATSVI